MQQIVYTMNEAAECCDQLISVYSESVFSINNTKDRLLQKYMLKDSFLIAVIET